MRSWTDRLVPANRDADTALRRRRRWLTAGVAAVAASAGVAWQLRKRQPQVAAPQAPSPDVVAGFWRQRFARPGGGELVMAALRGKPLVLNFWASWCPPCVREMPELDRFQRNHGVRGWQVIGLAIDNEAPVVQFLERVRVGFPVALAGLSGTDLMKRLGNDKGGLPFTVLFDRGGNAVRRHVGEITYAQLEALAGDVS